ncbi:MAG: STAS domain-containing protein [Melioribacteraceae bacterium]|nr:STAS domain-containing protein [Melioribacteraceae bacterium]
MSQGKYYCAYSENHCFIKMSGDIRYTNCGGFKKFLDRIMSKDMFENILFDLSDTENIDSTNLGLIAKNAEFIIENHNTKPVIVSTNNNITELLQSIGFDMVFQIVKQYSIDENFEDIPNESLVNSTEMGKTLLEAHRKLMELNEKNRDTFIDVVKALEMSVEKKSNLGN